MIWSSYGRQYMKKILIIICVTILTSCATPPAAYIPPAPDLIKGADRYSCKFVRNTSYNNKLKYYFWDIEGSSKQLKLHYATIYKHYTSSSFKIKSDDGDTVTFVSSDQKSLATFKRSSGVYTYDRKVVANCFHLEGPNYKVAKKVSKSNRSTTSKSSGGASGSGFFVTNKGHIITNYHVVKNCISTPKIKYKDQDVNAKIIAKDKILDLALLKADLLNTKYLTLSKDKPQKLQRVIASGYPFGKYISDDLKFTSGIISSLKGPNDDSTLVQVDAALNPGNSGGPIVDEESGKLVAVSVMGMKKSISEGQNFGIKTSSVKNFLEANQVRVPSSWFGSGNIAKLLEDSTLYTFCK